MRLSLELAHDNVNFICKYKYGNMYHEICSLYPSEVFVPDTTHLPATENSGFPKSAITHLIA